MSYHINGKGEARRCRALKGGCPFGSAQEHRATPEEARAFFEDQMLAQEVIPSSYSTATEQALESALVYGGAVPNWLKARQGQSKERYGTEPRIIDVLDTALGKVAVVYEPNSLLDNDRSIQRDNGFDIRRIVYSDLATGEERGHIKLKYASPDAFARSFGTDEWQGLRFKAGAGSKTYGIRSYERDENGKFYSVEHLREATTTEEVLQAKQKIWVDGFNDFGEKPEGFDRSRLAGSWGRQLTQEHAPVGEQLEKELEELRGLAAPELEAFRKNYQSEATIDWIFLENEARGRGLSASLYIYGARMLGQEGVALRSSTLQSLDAKGAWAAMARNEKLPLTRKIKTWTFNDAQEEVYVLDFRGEAKQGSVS